MNHVLHSTTPGAPLQATTAERVLTVLGSHQLKQEKPHHYRCNSPLRPGSDSHGFVIILDPDGEHGAYFDHAHEEDHGSLYELADKLGIPTPSASLRSLRQPIVSTKRVYRGLVDYAQAHGVTAEIFAVAGWSETVYQGRPALAFVTQTGTRYRFLDGDKPTYKSPPGYERCWCGLKRAIQIAQETGQALVICNGEASTVVGQQYNVAACAVTGGEKKALPAYLLDELKAAYQGPVIIAFDCLDKGAEAAPALATQLTAAGFEARAVDLGLGKGGDLADFCHLHQIATGAALATLPDLRFEPLPSTQTTCFRRWNWIHADQLDNLPPIRWLIPDEIPEQALVVLFGPSGAGKSFIALDYSLRVAQDHPVLYIAAEGHAGYANRKIAWCKHHNLPAGQLYFPDDNTVVGLLDPRVVQDFIASVTPLQPKLIVFDTLAWCMTGGDENSTSDMQRFITHCRQIQTATGATIMLVHHTGKSGASERGSSALRGGADMMIEITNDDDVITLSCSKSKETEGFDDRHLARLTMDTRPGETSCVWIPTEKVVHSKTDKLSRQQRDVLATLDSPMFSEVGARFAQLADALPNISRSGLYKILNRLMHTRLGYVTQGKKGEPFTITDAGRTALSTAENPTTTGKFTVSTESPLPSTETPSLLSTMSTPPLGGGLERQRVDKTETLSMFELTTLAAFGAHCQANIMAFIPPARVFSVLDEARLAALRHLGEQGCLESQGSAYRLTDAGWDALGMRADHIDLKQL